MSAQVQLSRARSFAPAAVAPSQPVPLGGGASSEPHITMSPDVPADGRESAGITFMVVGVGGTFLEVWKRESGSGIWAILARFTPPDFAVFKWMDVCSLNASELYFVTDAQPGTVPGVPFLYPLTIYLEETST